MHCKAQQPTGLGVSSSVPEISTNIIIRPLINSDADFHSHTYTRTKQRNNCAPDSLVSFEWNLSMAFQDYTPNRAILCPGLHNLVHWTWQFLCYPLKRISLNHLEDIPSLQKKHSCTRSLLRLYCWRWLGVVWCGRYEWTLDEWHCVVVVRLWRLNFTILFPPTQKLLWHSTSVVWHLN